MAARSSESGPPEKVTTIPASHTGQYLRTMLERR